MVFCVYLNQYTKFRKMFQKLIVDLIEIYIFCNMHFFLQLIISKKINDTFDIKFKYPSFFNSFSWLIYQAWISHHLGPKISTLWASKNTLSVWLHLIGDDLNL